MLGLPLELRRRIYWELFISTSHDGRYQWDCHHPHLREREDSDYFHCSCAREMPSQSLDYSILRVCRQLYEEALPMLYDETRFYESIRHKESICGDPHAEISAHLSNLRHVRFEADVNGGEMTTNSILLLLEHWPLLKDLELQIVFRSTHTFASHTECANPHGELVAVLSQFSLRKGLILTFKDEVFVSTDVARDFRLAIAPEEKWCCNGWDYLFKDHTYEMCALVWARTWSLGRSGTDLRRLKEPSEKTIDKITK